MTEHNDLQHKLVNDVYAELGTISKHSQDVIDYLMCHGWIRTPDEAEAAARSEMPRRTMGKQQLIKKIADEYTHLAPAVDTIINATEHEGWLRNPNQVPALTITESRLWEISQLRAKAHGWDDRKMLEAAGVHIVPDPELTNAEKWEKFIREANSALSEPDVEDMAAHMDQFGVKAPGGDHE